MCIMRRAVPDICLELGYLKANTLQYCTRVQQKTREDVNAKAEFLTSTHFPPSHSAPTPLYIKLRETGGEDRIYIVMD